MESAALHKRYTSGHMRRTLLIVVALSLCASGQTPPVRSRASRAGAIFHEATGLLPQITNESERDYIISELVQAEARAGFSSEAISTAAFRSKDQDSLLIEIGRIEASQGQYGSAMAAVVGQPQVIQNQVLRDIGIDQARRGEVQSAVQTAASMIEGYDKESVLYFVALELQRQGQPTRANEIAGGFTAPDHQLPDPSTLGPDFDWRKSIPPPAIEGAQTKQFYEDAAVQLRLGNLDKAISIIEADDNPADISSNFSRLARKAADSDNLTAALKLAAKVHIAGAEYENAYYDETLLPIGRSWARKDANAAAQWARGRRTSAQRASALAGVAEGVATSR